MVIGGMNPTLLEHCVLPLASTDSIDLPFTHSLNFDHRLHFCLKFEDVQIDCQLVDLTQIEKLSDGLRVPSSERNPTSQNT